MGVPIHMHTSQYLPEFYEIIRRHGKTPVHFLHDIGFLGPKTILTHLLYTSLNPVHRHPVAPLGDRSDVEMLADTETTLGHTPAVWARIGLPFHSYARVQRRRSEHRHRYRCLPHGHVHGDADATIMRQGHRKR